MGGKATGKAINTVAASHPVMADRLAIAIRIVERQADTLNNRKLDPCAGCGVARYENFDEYVVKRDLLNVATRLRGIHQKLLNGEADCGL